MDRAHETNNPDSFSDEPASTSSSDTNLNKSSDSSEAPIDNVAIDSCNKASMKIFTKEGIRVLVFPDKTVIVTKDGDVEVPSDMVTTVSVKRGLMDILRLESTVILGLECGRNMSIKRIPLTKASPLQKMISRTIPVK